MATNKIFPPKFHDKFSLCTGAIVGLLIVATAIMDMLFSSAWWWILPMVVGMVLTTHCLDMLRYWKRHRIVRIVKTDTERLIYKGR